MNIERMRKVVDAIADDPKAFNMEVWHCDTEACFAGHAVDAMAREQGLLVRHVKDGKSPWSYECQIGDGPVRSWKSAACEYLGLTTAQGDMLFDPSEWPIDRSDAYYDAQEDESPNGMVAALRGLVEDFIASGGKVPRRREYTNEDE